MANLSPALNTHLLTQAHAHGWRKDLIKHHKFLLESLLKLANNKGNKKGELQLSACEIAQLTDLSPVKPFHIEITGELRDTESGHAWFGGGRLEKYLLVTRWLPTLRQIRF